MDYKKLTAFQKWYLKYTNRPAYIAYKRMLPDYDFYHNTAKLHHPPLDHPYKTLTTFRHSGNIGDIIYALPTVFELSKNGKAHLYLQINQPAEYSYNYHPLGGVMLTEKMVELLTPLLLHQPQIDEVRTYSNEAF